MHDKTDSVKETVFQRIANRESKYYKHSEFYGGQIGKRFQRAQKVDFQRTVLSEADINFSLIYIMYVMYIPY